MKQNIIIGLLVIVVGLLVWPQYQQQKDQSRVKAQAEQQYDECIRNDHSVFGLESNCRKPKE